MFSKINMLHFRGLDFNNHVQLNIEFKIEKAGKEADTAENHGTKSIELHIFRYINIK